MNPSQLIRNGVWLAALSISLQAWAGGKAEILWQRGGFRLILADLVFSPRGDVFATSPNGGLGDSDTTIKLFRTSDGLLATTFAAQTNIYRLAFSNDGSLLVASHASTAGDAHVAEVWSIPLGTRLRFLRNTAPQNFSSLAFGAQTPWLLATGLNNGRIRLWDAESGELLQELTGPTGIVERVVFSPDEMRLISGSSSGTIIVWARDAAGTYSELVRFPGNPLYDLDLSSDGDLIAAGGQGGVIQLWRISEGSSSSIPDDMAIGRLRLSPDGRLVATVGGATGTARQVKFYELSTGEKVQEIGGNDNWLPAIAFAPDGSKFAYVNYPRDVKMAERGPDGLYQFTQSVTGFNGTAFAVRFSPDGRNLVSGAAKYNGTNNLGEVKVWNLDGTLNQTLPLHNNGVYSVGFDSTGRLLASGSWDHTVRIWERESPDSPFQLRQTLTEHTNQVNASSFSPDDSLIAAASDDHTVIVWRRSEDRTYQYLQTLVHDDKVEPMVFSRDGSLLISGGHDQAVKVWHQQEDGSYGAPQVLQHSGQVESLALRSDGLLLAAGGSDGIVRQWGREDDGAFAFARDLTRQNGEIHGLTFSPDDRVLVSAAEGQVSFWSAYDGSGIFTYDQETGTGSYSSVRGVALQGLAFSPDMALFAYARVDATITVARNPYTFGSPPSFGDPLAGLSGAEVNSFVAGRVTFQAEETIQDGLGPVFNDRSCARCHAQPVAGGSGSFLATRFGRLSPEGQFDPLIEYGGPQLQGRGIGWIDGTGGNASCHYVGEVVPEQATIVAHRRTPPLFGLGFVDALAEDALIRLADKEHAEAPEMAGTLNWVPNLETGQTAIGRFGWKAQNPSLFQFVADAYLNEMGITNPLFPDENCPQGDCDSLRCNPRPGVNDPDGVNTRAFARFISLLAAPPRREITEEVRDGENLFLSLGCDFCHRPTLRTGPSDIDPLNRVDFHAYSDFLLHDMGNLGDGITEYAAGGQQMRTAPLWGLRMEQTYLHDGRATSLDEAIRSHDGQGAEAREAFNALGSTERALLISFLQSL